MLIRFSVENWMSFRERITFSMLATRERQHPERVPKIARYGAKVLPVAAIYGGNASGKTNLVKALSFAKEWIVRGSEPDSLIPVEVFRLDPALQHEPARFCFEIYTEGVLYEFSFAVTRQAVIEEKLVEIKPDTTEAVLYERQAGGIKFGQNLREKEFLAFAFRGTRDNQLFLTNAVSQKVETFEPVYDWFKYRLVLMMPRDRFMPPHPYFDQNAPLFLTFNLQLSQLDTGIHRLSFKDAPLESYSLLQENHQLRVYAEGKVKEGEIFVIMSPDFIILTRENGQLVAKKMVTYHLNATGQEVAFDLEQESDGSQRMIDLLPVFLESSQTGSDKVYVIDELDRSLHTLLTQSLLQGYLSACSPESRSQLLFTTHDVLLMDQRLFRRDEMWVTERDAAGASTLYSFSEYKDVRYDKDIRKSYLQGRLGGIPRFLAGGGKLSFRVDVREGEPSHHGAPE